MRKRVSSSNRYHNNIKNLPGSRRQFCYTFCWSVESWTSTSGPTWFHYLRGWTHVVFSEGRYQQYWTFHQHSSPRTPQNNASMLSYQGYWCVGRVVWFWGALPTWGPGGYYSMILLYLIKKLRYSIKTATGVMSVQPSDPLTLKCATCDWQNQICHW